MIFFDPSMAISEPSQSRSHRFSFDHIWKSILAWIFSFFFDIFPPIVIYLLHSTYILFSLTSLTSKVWNFLYCHSFLIITVFTGFLFFHSDSDSVSFSVTLCFGPPRLPKSLFRPFYLPSLFHLLSESWPPLRSDVDHVTGLLCLLRGNFSLATFCRIAWRIRIV